MSSSAQIIDYPPLATFPSEAPAPWYALQTRPRHEKKVVSELQEKGITTYLPLISQVHRWSDRRKLVHLPLFSCYVFINAFLTPAIRLAALSSWGALGFVGPHKQAAPIPATEIESVRKLLESNVAFFPYPFLKIGQRVRIRGGCLDGLEGILLGRQRDKRLVISVESIERSLSITIEGFDVVPI
jgi:transcription termination/antitermination protein NusG